MKNCPYSNICDPTFVNSSLNQDCFTSHLKTQYGPLCSFLYNKNEERILLSTRKNIHFLKFKFELVNVQE